MSHYKEVEEENEGNTQEQLRALLRSSDESRIRSRYSSQQQTTSSSYTAAHPEGYGASRYSSASHHPINNNHNNNNDYTLSEKKVSELADLIGTIEGSNYTTSRAIRTSVSSSTSNITSRSLAGLSSSNANRATATATATAASSAATRTFEITPPNIDRNFPSRGSTSSYDRLDKESVRRSIDLETEEIPLRSDLEGEREFNDFAAAYQARESDRESQTQSYTRTTSTRTATTSVNSDPAHGHPKDQDQNDFTVIKFHQNYAIRGKHGKYLTAVPEELGNPATASSLPEQSPNAKAFEVARSPIPATRTYLLGADGQGIGELMDCLIFVPVDNKDNQNELRYGSVVAIKSSYSKERLLGLRDGTKLGFWRHVVGQGEKWVILKANQSPNATINSTTSFSGIVPSHQLNMEDITARGKYVRIGDTILLQTYKSDHCLSLVEVPAISSSSSHAFSYHATNTVAAGTGYEIRLLLKDRSGLGSEVWQVEVFGTVPLPTWCQTRPYLSGKYLVMPSTLRAPPPEVESRVFPRASNMSTFMQNIHSNLHPLNDYSLEEQQIILMREILLLLSGIEGNYIRLAAAVKSLANQTKDQAALDDAAIEEEMRKYKDIGFKEFHNSLNQRLSAPSSITLPSIDSIKLVIDIDSADRSLATQITQLLAMCEQTIKIRHFLRQQSRYEYGYVSHAFCASIKSILHDFDVIVCQLEYLLNQEKLSIQKFIFLLQQSKTTVQILDKMIEQVKETAGGQLLNELYSQYQQQGDQQAKQLYEYLLEKSFEPFINVLSIWIFRGELQDPYHEFMIHEDITVTKEALQEDFNAQYWDNRYTLQLQHTPTLFQPYSQKILNTGKYLNVIRDCIGDYAFLTESSTPSSGSSHPPRHRTAATSTKAISFHKTHEPPAHVQQNQHPMEKFLQFSQQYTSQYYHNANKSAASSSTRVFSIMNTQSCRTLLDAVDLAYQYSSHSLLQLLLNGYSLEKHFESLGKFFLLQHGDFFIQFMDIAEQDLRKEVKDITTIRLNHLLQLAIQTSTLANDDHKDLLSCTLASHNLIQHLHLIQTAGETAGLSINSANAMSDAMYASLSTQGLKGIEAFTLDYHVTWPLSIILSRRILTKYQLLSRLLYFSKHVERRLLTSWVSFKICKEIPLLRELLMESYHLRHRMLHFLQNFVYYITFEVMYPRKHEFEEELQQSKSSKDINEIMDLHERFLDNCLKECLLASSDLLKILTKIMTTCLLFADHLVKLFTDIEEHYQKKEEYYLQQVKVTAATGQSNRSPSVSKSQSGDHSVNATPATIAGGKGGGGGAAGKETAKGSKTGTATKDRLQQAFVQRQWKIKNYSELLFQEIKHESFHRIIRKFMTTFDQQLKEFLENLWTDSNRHHMQLSNLCVRLDYNGFYSSLFMNAATSIQSITGNIASSNNNARSSSLLSGIQAFNT